MTGMLALIRCLDYDIISELSLHTVNGAVVQSSRCKHRICSLAISVMPEGLYKNVIATGLHTGAIWLWNSWNLAVVGHIPTTFSSAVLSLQFSYDSYSLVGGSEQGKLEVWTQGDPPPAGPT